MKTRLLKTVSLFVAVLVILIVSAILFTTSSVGENVVRSWLERRLTAEVGLPVSIGAFETNLWSRVQIDSLTVGAFSDDTSESQSAVRVERIRIAYSIPQLLGATTRLKTLSVEGVDVGFVLDSLGQSGIPVLDAPVSDTAEAGQEDIAIRIDSVSLERMNLAYQDFQLPDVVNVDGAELSAVGHSGGLYSGRLTVDSISSSFDGVPLLASELEIEASLDSGKVTIEYAKTYFTGLHVECSGSLETGGSKRLELSASVKGRLDSLAAAASSILESPKPKIGDLAAQLQMEGTLDHPTVELKARVGDVLLQGVSIPSATISAEYANGEVLVDTLQLSAFNGDIFGAGTIALDSQGYTSASLALENIDIASAWKLVHAESSPYRGTVAGNINADGQGHDLSSWKADARLTATGLRYSDKSVPELKCRATFNQGRIDFALSHGSDEIHANLGLSGDTIDGTFDVSVPDLTALARFADQPELSGGLWASGTISGTTENPAVYSEATGIDIGYRGFPIDSLSAGLVYIDRVLKIESLFSTGSLDEVDPLRLPFGVDSIGGGFTYTCRLQGSLDYLRGTLSAQSTRPRYGDFAADSASIKAALDGSKIELSSLEVFREDLEANLRASYDTSRATGSFDLLLYSLAAEQDSTSDTNNSLIKQRRSLGSVEGTFALNPSAELMATLNGRGLRMSPLLSIIGDSTVTGGELDFELSLDGPMMAPNATLHAVGRQIGISDYKIDSMSTDIGLNPGALIMDSLVVFALGNTLSASGMVELNTTDAGSYEVDTNANVSARITTSDFDLAVLEAILQPGIEVSGSISAAIAVDGAIASPRITGMLSAENGALKLEGSPAAIDDIEARLVFEDSVLTVDSLTCTVSKQRVIASGLLATSRFESIVADIMMSVDNLGKVSVKGAATESSLEFDVVTDSIDITILQPFFTMIDSLSGNIACRTYISGKPDEPLIDGSLRVNELSFQSPEQNVSLSRGCANVRFDKSRVLLDSASAHLNGGSVRLSGSVSHASGELADIAATLRANGLRFQDSDAYEIVIDSAVIGYGQRNENYVLDGDIVLGEVRLTKGLRLKSILPWVKSVEAVELDLPDLIARSRIDVRIRESDELWIDNNLARIRLRAELGIIGTPLRPNFTGMIKIEEGYLLYLDRRFKVNQGLVFFNDPARFNPEIDLEASTQITTYRRTASQSYTIKIGAKGLLDQLEYGLYSEPALDKPDIIALLTLGATRSELTGNGDNGGQGLRGAISDRVSMLTSQRVSSYVSRKAGSIFGFDEFTIQGNLLKFDDSWGPQLIASKRLSRKFKLTYSTTVGHLNDQSVRLGYHLTPSITLQGETDRQGRSGLDLKYGIAFK